MAHAAGRSCSLAELKATRVPNRRVLRISSSLLHKCSFFCGFQCDGGRLEVLLRPCRLQNLAAVWERLFPRGMATDFHLRQAGWRSGASREAPMVMASTTRITASEASGPISTQ
jgi:hypothetical protein